MAQDKRYENLEQYSRAMQGVNTPAPPPVPRGDAARVDAALEQLVTEGYVVLERALGDADTRALRGELLQLMGATGRNSFEGFKTQRVYGVLARTLSCNPLVEHPVVLDLLDRLMLPNYLLSQLVAINILPGERAQLLHHDDALYPVPRPRHPLSISSLWAFDDFTAANGATRVVPRSHRWGDDTPSGDDLEAAIALEMPAGSVVVFLGTLWHGGGANTTEHSRLCVTAQYCEPWCRTVENFALSTSVERARRCSSDIQRMLGYSIHSPLVGYVDGRHPKHLLATPGGSPASRDEQ